MIADIICNREAHGPVLLSVKNDQRRTCSAGFEKTLMKFRKKSTGYEGGQMK